MAETRSNFSVIPKSQFSKIFNPIDESISSTQPMSQIKTPMPINQNPVIRNAGMFLEPQTPPMGSPMPSPSPIPGQKSTRESIMNKFTMPQSEQRGFAAQQGIQRGLLDQFLSDNRPEVERKQQMKNKFEQDNRNRVK